MIVEVKLSGRNPDGLIVRVDDRDLAIATSGPWYAHRPKASKTIYAKRPTTKGTLYLHRLIVGAKPGDIVDHIDGNGLNCTLANLRIVNRSENAWMGAARRAFDECEAYL